MRFLLAEFLIVNIVVKESLMEELFHFILKSSAEDLMKIFVKVTLVLYH